MPQSWNPVPGGAPAAFTAARHTCPNAERPIGRPASLTNTNPSAGVGNAARCAASTSTTTCGSGTVRTDARVLGGDRNGGRPFTVTSCRSTRCSALIGGPKMTLEDQTSHKVMRRPVAASLETSGTPPIQAMPISSERPAGQGLSGSARAEVVWRTHGFALSKRQSRTCPRPLQGA